MNRVRPVEALLAAVAVIAVTLPLTTLFTPSSWFRPSVLLVLYDGRCTELPLKDSSEVQKLTLDTGVAVTELLVAIGATYPARADAGQPLTALTSLAVLSRPH